MPPAPTRRYIQLPCQNRDMVCTNSSLGLDRKWSPVCCVAILLIATYAYSARATALNACEKPLYLTFDTGHMAVAPLVAEVLNRQKVKATFFAANERTKTGDGSPGQLLGALVEGARSRRP